MRVAMPTGNTHGWGIAGTYLSAEIAKLSPVENTTLHCVAGHHFAPADETKWDGVNIGYCFFEHEILAYRFIPQAARQWDHIVAGSTWCEHHLRIAGMDRTSTILQGIDRRIFRPAPPHGDDERFVVFSGGKFEFRKGHDIVIAAMSIFMARHPDVWLSCAWHNHWPQSIKTMEQSRLIDFSYRDVPCDQLYYALLAANGIDPHRVILHPVMENQYMQQVYAATDIGLFPNRCEGGNNMVMCEYMACGRPVIASKMTGHQDVVSADYALCPASYEPVLARVGGDVTGVWFEPEVEEVVGLLEEAYQDRQKLQRLGAAAATAMADLSWDGAARQFHELALQIREKRAASRERNAYDEGQEHFEKGCFSEAEACFRSMLSRSPLDPDLHNALATTLDRLERYPEATLHYEKALALRPDFTVARFNLANTLKRMEKPEEAVALLDAVVAEDPSFVAAWQNLALSLFDLGDLPRAAECLRRVLTLTPQCQRSRTNLGEILLEQGLFGEAVQCFDAVLEVSPHDNGVLNSKGTALQEMDDLDGAEACYRTILGSDPNNVLALNNLATVLRSKGLPTHAIDVFDQALAHAPGDGQIIFNRSLARLAICDFSRGWDDYEERFHRAVPVALRHQELPRWNGEPLDGCQILVQSEQGYGDTFQFVRYLPLLVKKHGPILFEAQDPSVKSALHGLGPGVTVIARGEPLPPVEYQIPLLSLPRVFGTTLDSIPSPEGYLRPDDARKTACGMHLHPDGRLRVGLVWGGRKPRLNANRSISLSDLAPLFDMEGVRYVSLQVGEDASQLSPYLGQVQDMRHLLHNFGDTAALISSLDLVITIDTAVAHLAGALGAPTWVLLKSGPDWRWFMDRDDSPWYASARLFRQQNPGDWSGVVSSVRKALEDRLSEKKD